MEEPNLSNGSNVDDGGDGGKGSSPSSYLDLIVEGLLVADDPYDTYKNWRIIGHGGTAEVYKANRTDDDHVSVAIKKFRPQSTGGVTLDDIGNELRTLQSVHAHDHINTYIEGYVWENSIYVVLDYCSGSCTDILQLFKEPLREKEIAAICKHCLKALDYIHRNCKIVHRDIKAGNLLLSADGKILIADFGISKLFGDDEKTNTFIGSPYWMAPEVILAMETGTYSYSVDIWSLGITLIELAETKPPHFDLHGMSACYRIASGEPPALAGTNFTSAFHDFLRHCLVTKPEGRWTAKQLLQHEFVKALPDSEANSALKDLLVRSKAAVKAVDYSAITGSGLIVNIPPKLEESPQEAEAATTPPVNQEEEDEEEEVPTGFGDDDAQTSQRPLNVRSEAQLSQRTAAAVRVAVAVAPDPVNAGPNPAVASRTAGGRKAVPPRAGATNGARPPRAEPTADAAPTAAARAAPKSREESLAVTDHRSGLRSNSSPLAPHGVQPQIRSDTLKLPAQLAEERHRAMTRGGMLLKSQMREITKLRAKHTDELRQMQEKQKLEQASSLKAQDNQANALKRNHGAALSDFTKETEQENARLVKQQALAKKKSEEALKRAWNQREKVMKSELKQHLLGLKKQHKAMKESKQQINDLLDSSRLQRQKEIETTAHRFKLLEMTLLQAKHKIDEIGHNLERLTKEFEIRKEQLGEVVKLETEHKTGPLCDLQRHHIIRIHARQSKQQQERQALILDNLEDMARSELDRLLKQHNVASKQLKSTLKKLPVVDQQILAIFERRTTLKKSANNRQKSPSASAIPSLDRPVLPVTGSQVRSLPKEDQRELKSAKEEHSKNETVKLSEQQMLMMELRRGEKEKERAQLQALHETERIALRATHKNLLDSFDERILKTKNSTAQYIAMQKKNFAALRKEKIRKPQKRASNIISGHSTVLRSTFEDLKEFYGAQHGRGTLRPACMSLLSLDLLQPLAGCYLKPPVPEPDTLLRNSTAATAGADPTPAAVAVH